MWIRAAIRPGNSLNPNSTLTRDADAYDVARLPTLMQVLRLWAVVLVVMTYTVALGGLTQVVNETRQ